jgi:hypothetical protein
MTESIELKKIVEAIFLDHKFEFPITVALIGVRGYLVAKFELDMTSDKSKTTATFKSTILAGKAKDLRFPINLIFADSVGRAAHICFKRPDEFGDLMFFPVESKMPSMDSVNWSKA